MFHFIAHINTKSTVYQVLFGVFVLIHIGINCTENFIIFLLIKDSCCTVVYTMAACVQHSLSVTTGITCRAAKQFTLPDTREEGKNGKKNSVERNIFFILFSFLDCLRSQQRGRPMPRQRKIKKNICIVMSQGDKNDASNCGE